MLPGIHKANRNDAKIMFRKALIESVSRNDYSGKGPAAPVHKPNSLLANFDCSDDEEDDSFDVDEHTVSALIEGNVDAELLKYYAEPAPADDNVLAWWKLRATQFPIVSKLARKYLGVPSSSASVERLFSLAGNVISDERSSFDSHNAEALIFLRASWMPMLDYMEKVENRGK